MVKRLSSVSHQFLIILSSVSHQFLIILSSVSQTLLITLVIIFFTLSLCYAAGSHLYSTAGSVFFWLTVFTAQCIILQVLELSSSLRVTSSLIQLQKPNSTLLDISSRSVPDSVRTLP